MAEQWMRGLIDESQGLRTVAVSARNGITLELTTPEVRELLEYMEHLEEQDAMELLREQG